ncbi:MAG: magnesium transporter [Candidatus Helarchaeota archaeon]|nr:magnesium transporter [Candidatus Helarchaeota archaeon]
MLSALGSIAVGVLLGTVEHIFANFVGLLVLVPPLMSIRGAIGGSFSARLSTALHLGTVKPQLRNNTSNFKKSFIATLILTLILPIWIGGLAYLVTTFFKIDVPGGQTLSLLGFILIAELSGLLSGFLQAIITIFVSIVTYRRGLDPDVVVSPILYTTGDIIGVISLVFITQLLFISGFGLT